MAAKDRKAASGTSRTLRNVRLGSGMPIQSERSPTPMILWARPRAPLRRRIRALVRERRLGRGEPGDRHPIGRAGDIVEADLVAEADGGGIAAVLAADAELQVLARAAAALGADAHELAHALAVDGDEGVVRENALPLVPAQQPPPAVPPHPKPRLP